MTSAEAILRRAADDGSLDSYIVAEFPKPPPDHNAVAVTDLPSRPNTSNAISSQDSHATDKENAPPATPPRPPVPAFTSPAEAQAVPQDITAFYASIRTALSKNFAKHPPHTVQRLAELVLEPQRRYRYLPPYLRALDRVISVSSPLNIFPLPQAVLPTAGGLLNGTTPTNSASASLGSDESLGGALLTPIPWLQNRGQSEFISESTEMVDGPNGTGRIETVTVGMLTSSQQQQQQPRPDTPSIADPVAQIASSHPDGETLPSTGPVTQGELLRQEQEAGIVLNNPHTLTTSPTRSTSAEMHGTGSIIDTVEAEEEMPHARGPEIIGMEDTGPQKEGKGLNIEGAIGRPSVGERTSKSPGVQDEKKDEGGDEAVKTEEADAEKEKAKGEDKDADVDMKSEE
ncbi:hypothetical protein T440DRAFT_521372 [Plenodomus tracheiphilus IPT5]|uniref:Protein phosphatase 4 core regulatory subunit R2 n=1 Tax=Plenodomus tracheiphilus IPT5 TaxID=1408161 RepID=A0A6A7AXQ4_9PLEO|nr:hypothetical protein T440DRAFT_521372 [Plenodomus tracheiphilus IPT5]